MEFWWNNMLTLQKVLFIVACATTLIMVIQIILMLVGAGSNGFEAADGDLVGGADFEAARHKKHNGVSVYFFVGGLHLRLSHGLVVGFAHRGGRRRRGVAACCVAHDSRRKDSDRRHDKHTPCNRLQRGSLSAHTRRAQRYGKNQRYRAGKNG